MQLGAVGLSRPAVEGIVHSIEVRDRELFLPSQSVEEPAQLEHAMEPLASFIFRKGLFVIEVCLGRQVIVDELAFEFGQFATDRDSPQAQAIDAVNHRVIALFGIKAQWVERSGQLHDAAVVAVAVADAGGGHVCLLEATTRVDRCLAVDTK